MSENEEKGFKVVDRRASSQDTVRESKLQDKSSHQDQREEKVDAQKTATKEEAHGPSKEIPVPEASFLSLILMFYTEAQVELGLIPSPLTNRVEKNLPQAKYVIDILGILKDKTKGNLAPEEERALTDMLFDLRMKYVEATKK